MFKIIELDLSNKALRARFIDSQWNFYKDSKYWAPQLKMALHDLLDIKKHPFYKSSTVKAFVAVDEKENIVGRILGIINYTSNEYNEAKTGAFGFFEANENAEVAQALFNTVESWLKKEGMNKIVGPVNPSTNYDCGLLVDGFSDTPQVMMPYNPEYYLKLMDKNGLTKSMDLIAYRLPTDFKMPEIILKIAERAEKKSNVTFRTLNLKTWTKELDTMYEIYNSAWEDNWGFVPMSKEEFYHTAKELKSIVNPKLVHFVEVNGQMAGFILTLPDLNQVFREIPNGKLLPSGVFKILFGQKKYINRCRVITMGIKKEFRKMGLETLLYKHNHLEILKTKQFNEIEMSWILETNLEMNKPLLTMGAQPYKRYRIYEKTL